MTSKQELHGDNSLQPVNQTIYREPNKPNVVPIALTASEISILSRETENIIYQQTLSTRFETFGEDREEGGVGGELADVGS